MDFFESQARAHQKTRWLIVYFILAVLGIIATLHILAALILHDPLTDWRMLGLISGSVIVVVALGAVYRVAELSQGGGVVAQMLGGRKLSPHPTDLREIQLRNVVEEMALASSVPVPDIFVLDNENSINAFAAGNTPGDAAVAVTRGTLERLSRDELQGVIAHEFSHILNGDMRLNIRLIGVLTGILLLAILGRIVFEWGGTVRSDDRDGKNSQIPLFLLGAALFLVGGIGVFFAKLIKAAVSRQREFLADASAVQFTRNPDGIAGALWKIGQVGSRLETARADEAAHMFFGNGLRKSFVDWFATHPPIEDRIRAIDPSFDPSRVKEIEPSAEVATQKAAASSALPHLATAGAALAAIPEFARTAARETSGAVSMIYALLLSEDAATREKQLAAITLTPGERSELDRDIQRSGEIGDAMSVMDLSLPALRQLSPAQYATLRENVRKLIACDGVVNLFEFVLHKALVRHVDHYFTKSTGPAVSYRSVVPLLPDISTALSALAWHGNDNPEARDAAYQAGISALLLKPGAFPMQRTEGCDFVALENALDRMAEADPPTKRKILNACTQAARQDGVIRPEEAALLRAIADVLGCTWSPLDPENVA
jgi:Zn-dependent protease with chaperone function